MFDRGEDEDESRKTAGFFACEEARQVAVALDMTLLAAIAPINDDDATADAEKEGVGVGNGW